MALILHYLFIYLFGNIDSYFSPFFPLRKIVLTSFLPFCMIFFPDLSTKDIKYKLEIIFFYLGK